MMRYLFVSISRAIVIKFNTIDAVDLSYYMISLYERLKREE